MTELLKVKNTLQKNLHFSEDSLSKLGIYHSELLKHNQKLNLIGKSTEEIIWSRHILDSAQIVKFIDFKGNKSLSDLGSGAGFPGLVISIFNQNPMFHVKLFEKSPLKANFLSHMVDLLELKCEIVLGDIFKQEIITDYVVTRAFKKLPIIMGISREIVKKNHKLIIMKGKSAQEEINTALNETKFKYKLANSITNKEAKIILVDVIK